MEAAIKENLLKAGADDKEVAEAKKSYLEAEKVQRANDQVLVRVLAENLWASRTFDFYVGLEQKIADLTPVQVNEALRKHFDPKRLVTIRSGDFGKRARSSKLNYEDHYPLLGRPMGRKPPLSSSTAVVNGWVEEVPGSPQGDRASCHNLRDAGRSGETGHARAAATKPQNNEPRITLITRIRRERGRFFPRRNNHPFRYIVDPCDPANSHSFRLSKSH